MSPKRAPVIERAEFRVLMQGGQFDIIVEEMAKRPGYVVMRRWRTDVGQWQRKALGRRELRDARGRILADAEQWARDAAIDWYQKLTGRAPDPVESAPAPAKPFTVGEAWAAITDPKKGKYPHDSAFRDEIARALKLAAACWGTDASWVAIGEEDWLTLLRTRLEQVLAARHRNTRTGIRAVEILAARLITVIRWLRKTKRIPAGAAEPPEDWRDEIVRHWKGIVGTQRDPQVFRPRHTVDELRRLLVAARKVDPRYGLMMQLGAEYRLGQVARAMRSDLDVDAGTFTIHGAGHKGGEVVDLTPAQRTAVAEALAGYLAPLEAAYQAEGTDYCLFPGGRLRGKRGKRATGAPYIGADITPTTPIEWDTIRKWFRAAERSAEIEHVHGRGAYGLRRVATDAALQEKISERGLKAAGGWRSTKVPHEIYAEAENRAGRAEAASVRATVRGDAAATAPTEGAE